MKKVNIISTVVQRQISGEKIPTGNNVTLNDVVDIDEIRKELSKNFISFDEFKSYWEIKTDAYGNKYIYSPLHIATQNGITMYANEGGIDIPTILNSIPTAGYDDIQARGLIAFNSKHFVINNGVVSAIQGSAGIDEEQLGNYLKNNHYATEDWVKEYIVEINTGETVNITQQMVIDALGYTPYDASNPNGYITSATLDGYLPLSGGTLSGRLSIESGNDVKIVLNNNDTDSKYQHISFQQNGEEYGQLGTSGTDDLVWGKNGYWKTIIHTGNIDQQNVGSATKLQDNTSFTIWGQTFFENGKPQSVSGDLSGVVNVISSGAFIGRNSSKANESYFGNASSGVNGDGALMYAYGGRNLYFYTNGVERIRVTSSGNVGIGTTSPAYKLDVNGTIYGDLKMKTPRTLWGQSFDGTKDIDGSIALSKGSLITIKDSSNNDICVTQIYGDDIHFGSGANSKGYNTYIGGNRIIMRNGTSPTWGFVLSEIGNVGIGGVIHPQYKLDVNGDIYSRNKVIINGISLSKSQDGVLYLDGNLVVRGGITMYGTDATNTPSILDSLPKASYGADDNNKGIASFDGNYFRVTDGYVSLIADNVGIDQSVLEEILATKDFATKTDLSGYLPLSGGVVDGWVRIQNNKVGDGTLYIKGISTKPIIRFEGDVSWGYLGFGSANNPCYYDNSLREYSLIHSGNIGSQSVNYANTAGDADALSGLQLMSNTKGQYGCIPYIEADGVMEIGKYLDFHADVTSRDFSIRLVATGNYSNTVNLPSASGTIALITDNVASATKLSDNTSYTAWGQEFFVNGKPKSVNGAFRLLREIPGTVVIHKALVYPTSPYGLITRAYIDGDISLQVQREDNDSECFNLLLNPLGGNVGIGTSNPKKKVDVIGDIALTGYLYMSDSSNTYLPAIDKSGNTLLFGYGQTVAKYDVQYLGYNIKLHAGGGHSTGKGIDILANGNVGICTANPSEKLHVDGNILATGGITMYSARILKNIVDERGLSLDELSVIKPTRYTWKDGRDNNIHFGGIADDIQQVLPEVVYKTAEGVLTMDYGNAGFAIAASLIKPVVDHEEKIRQLQKRVSELEQELNRLRA